MRAVLSLALCSFFLLSAGPILADPTPVASPAAATAMLLGLVVDANNALPIVGAEVRLRQTNAAPLETTTDAAGRYSFTTVPGFYSVTISAR